MSEVASEDPEYCRWILRASEAQSESGPELNEGEELRPEG